jgi:hypothetical protein
MMNKSNIPKKLLNDFDINDPNINRLINKRCNKNLARLLSIFKVLKKDIYINKSKINFMKSYKILKNIPQGPMSLILSIPTFSYWLNITENLIRRFENNESIPFEDTPHLQGIKDLSKYDIFEYHLTDFNRFLLAMSILSYQSVKLKIVIYEGLIVIPYFGINIKISKELQIVEVDISEKNPHILNVIDLHKVDISFNILTFQNGNSALVDNKSLSQSQSILFSKGRVIISNYEPYYKYEMISQYVFPNKLKASIPNKKDLIKWGETLNEAQKTLQDIWPEIEKIIGFYIYDIIPMKSPEVDRNISCTSNLFPSAIFCSYSNSIELAEVLIHEFSHNLLNDVMDNYNLIDKKNSLKAKYYSPWRPDPRHLQGMLHAVYVFEKVAHFYSRVLLRKIKKIDYKYRYSLIVTRLKISISILMDNGKFNDSGIAVINTLKYKIENHVLNKEYNKRLSEKEIYGHFIKWVNENKELKNPKVYIYD